MSIPQYNEIMVPALKLLSKNDSLKPHQFVSHLAKFFNLSDEELALKFDSGNTKIFYNRITWALTYLKSAGLVQKSARGVYEISEIGRTQLGNPNTIPNFIKKKNSRTPIKNKGKKQDNNVNENLITPQEELYASSTAIKNAVCDEIIENILSKSPREFEKLVVALLQAMGYGGEIENSGEVTKYSNDKGIDGIIKEDVLGLGRIHIQAKRYAKENAVSRNEVQGFIGALAGASSNKGVFITTSYYSKSAIKYAENLNSSTMLVLIDGKKLSDFIYRYGIGMQVEQTIKIKKLDSDYWDTMEDDDSK